MKTDEELADDKIKEMFPSGYCVSGNYEGYKRAILEGIKMGKDLKNDTIVDFPKIIAKFMDNRDNRRNYSSPCYDSENKDWQLGGDYCGDNIRFKRATVFKDKNGKNIYEWDYILVDNKKCLITLNGGQWQYEDEDGYSGSISLLDQKDIQIVGEYNFNGKIVIKNINNVTENIEDMVLTAKILTERFSKIKNGN